MLFSLEEVEQEFQGMEFEILEDVTIQLKEGNYHQGKASVTRFLEGKVD